MEKGGLMDNVYMQNTTPFVCVYLKRLLGRRYHSNGITCYKLKENKLNLRIGLNNWNEPMELEQTQ